MSSTYKVVPRWKKGQSGNPGGRPRRDVNLLKLARSYTTKALETLVELMLTSESPQVRLNAANSILDRGHGKPIAMVSAEVSGGLQVEGMTVQERLAALSATMLAVDTVKAEEDAGEGSGEGDSDGLCQAVNVVDVEFLELTDGGQEGRAQGTP